jgi:hypothetical protein
VLGYTNGLQAHLKLFIAVLVAREACLRGLRVSKIDSVKISSESASSGLVLPKLNTYTLIPAHLSTHHGLINVSKRSKSSEYILLQLRFGPPQIV